MRVVVLIALLSFVAACGGTQRGRSETRENDAGVDLGAPDLGLDAGPPDLGFDAGPPPLPMPEPAPDLALAGETSCVLRGEAVLCWGSNRFGQLGDPTLEAGHTVRRAQPRPVAGLERPLRIVAGAFHVCALQAAGTVRCWGHGGWGQLGHGVREDSPTPVEVVGLDDAVDLALGTGHTCALRSNGSVVCWGRNTMGQLGDGSVELRLEPTEVPAVEGAVQVVAGVAHTCARRDDGSVLCWGENVEGQLGDGTRSEPTGYRPTPAAVHELAPARGLASGAAHVCARTDEDVACWGRNDSLQLGASGRGSAAAALTEPRAMNGVEDAVALALGARFSCARIGSGELAEVRCLGLDHRGQLGNGSRRLQRHATPTEPLPSAVVALEAGVQHTCAVLDDLSVHCWGDDRRDQIGAGRHRLVATPHRVLAGVRGSEPLR